jgi:hypothetical protein
MGFVRSLNALVCLAAILLASSAGASSIVLSTHSSDSTPASQFDAILDFVVGEFDGANPGDELKLTLTNPLAGDALFNVNAIYWNAAANVVDLTPLSATHSAAGDVLGAWAPVDPDLRADGFGMFDFALTDGVGEMNPNIAEPGESIVFIFDIDGAGVTMTDFVVQNTMGFLGAGKFVNGPGDDSGFGATLPEPGAGALMLVGIVCWLGGSRPRG